MENKEEEHKEENKEEHNDSKESLIQTADRLEKANQEAKEILQRQEEIAARNLLGGKSEMEEEPIKKEETAKEYKDRIEKEFSEGKLK